MKNEITIYELFGLVKDDNAPYKIKYDDVVYTFDGSNYVYNEDEFLFTELLTDTTDGEFLNKKVEIIPEEKEWEDIEFENYSLIFSDDDISGSFRNFSKAIIYNKELIEQLIKNQKKIIEKLEDKDEK